MTPIVPIARQTFQAAALMTGWPPVLHHANKGAVYELACPPGTKHTGQVGFSRWAAMPLPGRVDPAQAAVLGDARQDVYDYKAASSGRGAVEWHVNFADPYLFFAYSGPLFAQDEMQVAEHPALGSLKEALSASGAKALTVEERRPTPILVTGVLRMCRIATGRNAAEGRPQGLYGNAFATASAEAIRRAVTPTVPPTVTNLIAIAAPYPAQGAYTRAQVEHVLVTAYTGFRAACVESAALGGEPGGAVVHTGFWGCGAFGGNRVLMATLQLLAAQTAGVGKIVFHTSGSAGMRSFDEAQMMLSELGRETDMDAVIGRTVERGFRWGVGNGT